MLPVYLSIGYIWNQTALTLLIAIA